VKLLPPSRQVDQRDTHRLIPAQFADGGTTVLTRLTKNDNLLDGIIELDNATNDRLWAESGRAPGIGERELVFGISSYRIIKHRHWFIISSFQDAEAETIVIEEKDVITRFTDGSLELRTVPIGKFNLKAEAVFACLDKSGIQFPLLLRKWKQGDYFYPLGMKKKKKLSRFFIDQKLSKTAKEKQWVIEMNKKIIWVVGVRIDDRFKVNDRTKEVLELSIKPIANGRQ